MIYLNPSKFIIFSADKVYLLEASVHKAVEAFVEPSEEAFHIVAYKEPFLVVASLLEVFAADTHKQDLVVEDNTVLVVE
jgi:hypothetical protein